MTGRRTSSAPSLPQRPPSAGAASQGSRGAWCQGHEAGGAGRDGCACAMQGLGSPSMAGVVAVLQRCCLLSAHAPPCSCSSTDPHPKEPTCSSPQGLQEQGTVRGIKHRVVGSAGSCRPESHGPDPAPAPCSAQDPAVVGTWERALQLLPCLDKGLSSPQPQGIWKPPAQSGILCVHCCAGGKPQSAWRSASLPALPRCSPDSGCSVAAAGRWEPREAGNTGQLMGTANKMRVKQRETGWDLAALLCLRRSVGKQLWDCC